MAGASLRTGTATRFRCYASDGTNANASPHGAPNRMSCAIRMSLRRCDLYPDLCSICFIRFSTSRGRPVETGNILCRTSLSLRWKAIEFQVAFLNQNSPSTFAQDISSRYETKLTFSKRSDSVAQGGGKFLRGFPRTGIVLVIAGNFPSPHFSAG